MMNSNALSFHGKIKARTYSLVRNLNVIVLIGMPLLSQPLSAASFFVDEAKIEQTREGVAINVKFNLPINIKAYSPKSQGSLLNIGVQTPSPIRDFDPGELGKVDWLGMNEPAHKKLYESIRFERTNIREGILAITFRETTNYIVTIGSDARSIVIQTDRALPDDTEGLTSEVDLPEKISIQSVPEDEKKQARLMEDARQAMVRGDYSRAVQVYTKILQEWESESHPETDPVYVKRALEYLGVARERKNQLAHAHSVYREFLGKYPEGEDAVRVKQRIAGLMSLAQATPEKRREAKADDRRDGPEWLVFGGLSQFYRYADFAIDDEESETLEDSLRSDLDLTARVQTDRWDFRSRFSGGYINDFRDESPDDQRLSDLYIDLRDKESDAAFRLGRQNSSKGGVLGRFDGFLGGIQLGEQVRMNLVTGYPVDSITILDVETDRYFYGLNIDIAPLGGGWEYNAFVIEQRAEGLLDRRGVGGELRYLSSSSSLFTLLDYDIEFDELNTFLLVGNTTMEGGTNFSLTADYRNSPTLTLRNALSGQQVEFIKQLLEIYTEEELRQFALDRTAKSTFINFGVTHPLNETYQLTANVSVTSFGDSSESGGVPAIEGTGDEYSYDASLIASGLFLKYDTNIFSVRYFDGNRNKRTTFSLDSRYPITPNLRVNPRLRVDYQDTVETGTNEWRFRPSIRLDYRWRRRVHLELELRGEWTTRDFNTALGEETETTEGYSVSLGYRLDF